MIEDIQSVLVIITSSLGIYKLWLDIKETKRKQKNKKKRPSGKGRRKK